MLFRDLALGVINKGMGPFSRMLFAATEKELHLINPLHVPSTCLPVKRLCPANCQLSSAYRDIDEGVRSYLNHRMAGPGAHAYWMDWQETCVRSRQSRCVPHSARGTASAGVASAAVMRATGAMTAQTCALAILTFPVSNPTAPPCPGPWHE